MAAAFCNFVCGKQGNCAILYAQKKIQKAYVTKLSGRMEIIMDRTFDQPRDAGSGVRQYGSGAGAWNYDQGADGSHCL